MYQIFSQDSTLPGNFNKKEDTTRDHLHMFHQSFRPTLFEEQTIWDAKNLLNCIPNILHYHSFQKKGQMKFCIVEVTLRIPSIDENKEPLNYYSTHEIINLLLCSWDILVLI